MDTSSPVPEQPFSGGETVDSDTKLARVQRRLALHMPVDVRSVSLGIIATILCFYALQWAAEIVVPILMGIMVSYALGPVVDRLGRWKMPRALGATAVLSAIVIAMGWGFWSLGDQIDALLDTIPNVSQKIRDISQTVTGKTSTIERVQRAATDLAEAAEASSSPASASETTVRASRSGHAPTANRSAPTTALAIPATSSRFDIRSYVITGTVGLLSFLGKVAVVIFLALFLLSSGNSFRRKMVKLAGPKLSQKKVTIETLDEITEQIQRYLLVQLGVSVVVGVVTWLVFFALGVNQAAVWGVVSAVANLIPYVGALLVGAGAAVVALVQFGTPSMALLVSGSSFAIHAIIGNVLTPWWMGKASKMSAVAVFVAVLVCGWLWGVAGLLLGVPILLVVKTVCDRVEDLKPIGELLGA